MATSQATNLDHKTTRLQTQSGKDAYRCSCGPMTHRMPWMSDAKWDKVKSKFFRRHGEPLTLA